MPIKSRRQLEQTVAQQREEIRRLKRALRAFVAEDEASVTDEEDDSMEDDDDEENTELGKEGEEMSVNSETAVDTEVVLAEWDDIHHVYRCWACNGEVVDSVCQFCEAINDIEAADDQRIENMYRSVTTDDEAIRSERRLAPRGSTPLLEIDLPEHLIPCQYGADEFHNLLRRGATRLMCETFHLEYDEDKGIVAWADSDIYETYAGPKMQKGDFWKIHLGRCLTLEADDLDGSQFIDDLLEEVLHYPLCFAHCDRLKDQWETVEETPGIWVTRPIRFAEVKARSHDHNCAYDDTEDAIERRAAAEDLALDSGRDQAEEDTAIWPNEYEASDVDLDDTEPNTLAWHSGWTFAVPAEPDVAYEPSDEEEEDADGETEGSQDGEGPAEVTLDGDAQTAGPDPKTDDIDQEGSAGDATDSDEAGSDWDSDETMSGDETVLSQTREDMMAYKTPAVILKSWISG